MRMIPVTTIRRLRRFPQIFKNQSYSSVSKLISSTANLRQAGLQNKIIRVICGSFLPSFVFPAK